MGIPSIIENNKIYTSPQEKANLFSNFFLGKSELPCLKPKLPSLNYITNSKLQSITITEEKVVKVLKSLDTTRANGPDNISNTILNQTSCKITSVLSKLFNISLKEGKFPDKWKEANVTSVHKKGDRQNQINYRPISLLLNLGKVIELYEYCKKKIY